MAVGRLLDQHIRNAADDGCDYSEGWSDQLIADAAIPGFGTKKNSGRLAVERVREELYGKLRPIAAPVVPAGVEERLCRVEAALSVLCERLGVSMAELGIEL